MAYHTRMVNGQWLMAENWRGRQFTDKLCRVVSDAEIVGAAL